MRFKKLTVISSIAFFLLMLPVFSLTLVNRASGDDYGYGIYTRSAWVRTHSLFELGKAVAQTIRQYYMGWQGTWFSVLLFSLQPEVFHDRAYAGVAVVMLFLWIGSTFYLLKQILYRTMKLDKWAYFLISLWFLIISIEFIPSTKSSIYWFNGCAHYMVPFAMCQIVAVWLLKYGQEYRKRTLFGLTVFMAMLGGSNYQAALFVLTLACYMVIYVWIKKRDKRILRLLLPVGAELTGLIISMKAPGNKVRGGETFGFSFVGVIKTVIHSFRYGIRDIGAYLKEKPLVFAGLFLIFVFLIIAFCEGKQRTPFRHTVLIAGMLFCLYSAMQAPAVYANVDVSGGVYNMNFQVFMLTAMGIMMILANRIAISITEERKEAEIRKIQKGMTAFGILFIFMITVIFRSSIKASTSYICLRYIVSGEAADYKEQMDLQTQLLEKKGVEDVVVPFINDVQGPLMHMPVTGDADRWINRVTADFYRKDSVVAIGRPKWEELYGSF